MAKEKNNRYDKPMRNRGEDFGEPRFDLKYDYQPADQYSDKSQERAIRRHEVRAEYDEMYKLEQRRDQRAFNRTRDMENEFYAGVDPRRRQEVAEGGIVKEDLNAMANLPRQAIHHEYPQAGYYASQYIDDTVRGADPKRDDDMMPMTRFRNVYNQYDR